MPALSEKFWNHILYDINHPKEVEEKNKELILRNYFKNKEALDKRFGFNSNILKEEK